MTTTLSIGPLPFFLLLVGLGLSIWGCSSPNDEAARTNAEAEKPDDEPLYLYVGTYTRGESEGIYLLRLDPTTGSLEVEGLAGRAENPSFLALHPNGGFLYAVNEIGDFQDQESGAVSAFSIGSDRRLRLLNQQASGGSGACHLSLDRDGRFVLVANYGGGSVSVLPIAGDGSLEEIRSLVQHEGSGVHPRRQQRPHAHFIQVDPGNRFALAADLGLDKILIYRLDSESGELTPHDPPWIETSPGAGPRHLAFHPSGDFLYAINELDSTVTAYAWDGSAGRLSVLATVSTLPEDFEQENFPAEIRVHPSGRFLYGSNRGQDAVAVFEVEEGSGEPVYRGFRATSGATPRHFAVDPTGRYLLAANQRSDNVVVFRIDPETGIPEATGHSVGVPTPVCLLFLPR